MTFEQIAILQAVAAESKRIGWSYCKCACVIAHAAESLEILKPESYPRLFTEGMENAPEITALYDELISLIRETDLLHGQGNLGDDENPPADPLFTECALSENGTEFLAELVRDSEMRRS
ncbi:MAG TPA: hypothetical protein VF258_01700 [Luteolibacter sp.]